MHVIFKALPRNHPYSQEQRDRREKPGQPWTPHRIQNIARCVIQAQHHRQEQLVGGTPIPHRSPAYCSFYPREGGKSTPGWSRAGRCHSQPRGCLSAPHHHPPWSQLCPPPPVPSLRALPAPMRTGPAFPSAISLTLQAAKPRHRQLHPHNTASAGPKGRTRQSHFPGAHFAPTLPRVLETGGCNNGATNNCSSLTATSQPAACSCSASSSSLIPS